MKKPTCQHCGGEIIVKRKQQKYCGIPCSAKARLEAGWAEMDKQDILNRRPSTVKKYLIAKRGHNCEICNQTRWMKQAIPLILDHVDGHSDNNNRQNLCLVCPNCDAQLPTYKGRNRGNGRYSRKQRYHDGKSY